MVITPTEWVNSIVLVVKKNNKLRIYMDPRNLNKAIKRSHYPLLSFQVIKIQLSNAKYFLTLDAHSDFWMKKVLTFVHLIHLLVDINSVDCHMI